MPPIVEIVKEFHFDAAHSLPRTPPTHKCHRLHGHTYRVAITLRGPIDPHMGWLTDFGDIKAAWKPLEAQLDHNFLNDIPGLENSTAEMIAVWIWDRLIAALPHLHQVAVYETPTCGAFYRGESMTGQGPSNASEASRREDG